MSILAGFDDGMLGLRIKVCLAIKSNLITDLEGEEGRYRRSRCFTGLSSVEHWGSDPDLPPRFADLPCDSDLPCDLL